MYGKDVLDLTDEEYIAKHGYTKPYASAGFLELIDNPEELLKVADELKAAERIAKTAKQAKSLKEAQGVQKAISSVNGVKVGKSGRVHMIKQLKPEAVVTKSVKPAKIVTQEKRDLEAYKNATISANNALEMGNYDLARWFFKDADRFNPRSKNIFRKDGGIVSAKSGIHIKKANRGKFTDYCGGKVTSECIAKGKRSPNPAIRKRATFAANARKWKHQYGGKIVANWVFEKLGGK